MDLHFRLLLYCFQIVHNSYIHKNIHFHLLLIRVMYCFLLLFVLYFVNIPTPFGPFTLWNLFVVLLFRLLIVLYDYILLPRLFHLFLILMCGLLPAATSIASVISSSFVVPSSSVISAFTCVGSVLFWLSPNPNSPFALYPHVHTVPFAFNATK